jgi:hypothetical protein
MRKKTVVMTALVAGLAAGVALGASQVFAQAPAAANPKITQLQGCIDHFKQARKGWSQEPDTQATYDEKIANAKRLIATLQGGTDVPQDKIDHACKSPKSAPY